MSGADGVPAGAGAAGATVGPGSGEPDGPDEPEPPEAPEAPVEAGLPESCGGFPLGAGSVGSADVVVTEVVAGGGTTLPAPASSANRAAWIPSVPRNTTSRRRSIHRLLFRRASLSGRSGLMGRGSVSSGRKGKDELVVEGRQTPPLHRVGVLLAGVDSVIGRRSRSCTVLVGTVVDHAGSSHVKFVAPAPAVIIVSRRRRRTNDRRSRPPSNHHGRPWAAVAVRNRDVIAFTA